MDYLILIVGLLLLALLILLWKYAELKGRIEQRARQIFEEWQERELEIISKRRAEILLHVVQQTFCVISPDHELKPQSQQAK